MSFVLLVPALVGAVAVYLAERVKCRSRLYYFWVGAGANALFVLGAFLIMIEGLICVIWPHLWYARPIAEFLVGNFEEAGFRFYAHRAWSVTSVGANKLWGL